MPNVRRVLDLQSFFKHVEEALKRYKVIDIHFYPGTKNKNNMQQISTASSPSGHGLMMSSRIIVLEPLNPIVESSKEL